MHNVKRYFSDFHISLKELSKALFFSLILSFSRVAIF